MNTKRLEQVILTRKRQCCKCKKTMLRGDAAIKYVHIRTGSVQLRETKYWCMDCETRGREVSDG